jgi:hypothetical protein
VAGRQTRKHGGRTHEGGAEGAHDLRLEALLHDLVRRHTHKGAARELGVGYKTVLRFKESGKLTKALRLALERYLVEGPETPDSMWWRRVEKLEVRVQALEAGLHEARELVRQMERRLASERGRFQEGLAEMERRLALVEKQIHDLSRFAAERSTYEGWAHSLARDSAPGYEPGEGSQPMSPTPQTSRWADDGERSELVQAWQEAVAAEEKARTRLEQVRAAERRLKLELALIQDHRESVPPGEAWDEARRSREVAWRWDALEDRHRERRWLELRRWVRRMLTLGLWWANFVSCP